MADHTSHPATYHAQQSSNVRRSLFLLASMMGLLVGVVFVLGTYLGYATPVVAAVAAVFVAATSWASWYHSDTLIIRMTGALEVLPAANPRLHNLVEEIALAAGIPKPRIYLVEDRAPNAFATGRDPAHGAVAFTTGLLQLMDRAELEGVVAHELSHIKNRDTTVAAVAAATAGALAILSDVALRMTLWGGNKKNGNPLMVVAALLVALLAPLAGMLMQAAISRRREALADASAVSFTRNPAGLRAALQKLDSDSTVVRMKSRAAAHVWLESPLTHKGMDRVFATHPPLSERIAALEALEGYRSGPGSRGPGGPGPAAWDPPETP